jgi:hypothetical protein
MRVVIPNIERELPNIIYRISEDTKLVPSLGRIAEGTDNRVWVASELGSVVQKMTGYPVKVWWGWAFQDREFDLPVARLKYTAASIELWTHKVGFRLELNGRTRFGRN